MGIELEEFAADSADDGEGAGVFQAFGGFIDFLQGQLDVFKQGIVVDQAANAALPLVDLLEYLFEV